MTSSLEFSIRDPQDSLDDGEGSPVTIVIPGDGLRSSKTPDLWSDVIIMAVGQAP